MGCSPGKLDEPATKAALGAITKEYPVRMPCLPANRAAIALLLWLARERGYTRGSAELLISDLSLDTVRPDAAQWLSSRLPDLETPENPRVLVPRSPEVQQLFDVETSTFSYLLSCPETSEAVLIDPVLEQKERDLKVIKNLGLTLKYEETAPKEAPSLSEASTRIDEQASNPTAKAKALQAMKKKKMYEQQRDQLLATQFNVENLAFQQEQAEITAMAVNAMAAGHKTLKDQTEQVDIGAVDKLMDDMADLQDEMKAMNEALAQGTMVDGAADDELAAEPWAAERSKGLWMGAPGEFAKLEEEAAAMTLAGAMGSTEKPAAEPAGGYAAPSAAAAPVGEALPSAPP
eukprot:g13264.t1